MNKAVDVRATLESVADRIAARRLTVPFSIVIEMHRPLRGLTHTALEAFAPLLAPFVGAQRMKNLLTLFASAENIDLLLKLIDERSEAHAGH